MRNDHSSIVLNVLSSNSCFLFQALSQDKESLMKLKKSVKDIQQSGMSKWFRANKKESLSLTCNILDHVSFEMEFSKALDKLGDTALTRDDEEDDIGAAFQKFAVVTKELSALMKNMVSFFMILMWNMDIYLSISMSSKCSMQLAINS